MGWDPIHRALRTDEMRARRLRLHPTIGPRADFVKRHAICYAPVAPGRAHARSLSPEPVNVRGRRLAPREGFDRCGPSHRVEQFRGTRGRRQYRSAICVHPDLRRGPGPLHPGPTAGPPRPSAGVRVRVALFAIAIVTQLVPGIPRAVTQMSAVVLL